MAVRGSITKQLWARDFDNLRPVAGLGEAIAKCKALANGEIRWLLLNGPVGCGKTHLAVATAKLFDSLHVEQVADTLVRTAKVEWWAAGDLFQAQRASWGTDVIAPFERCREAHLLVVDDLGTEPPPNSSLWQSVAAEFMTLLDARYRAQALTLMTTNLDFERFNNRYTTRIISRVMELGEVVTIEAPDYRLVGRAVIGMEES